MFDLTLSFDNGPEPVVTPAVLDVLRRYGLHATFFVIGGKLSDPERRRFAERAYEEGHWIGNHTWTHATPLGDRHEVEHAEHEIESTERELGRLSHPDRLFRPFAGGGGVVSPRLLSRAAVDLLVRGRYTCVLWNAVPKDWEDPDGWVETALAQCLAQSWSLIVLHDLPTGAMRHLPRFLDRVAEAGGRFRQDFPPSCVPLLRGDIVLPMEPYVTT